MALAGLDRGVYSNNLSSNLTITPTNSFSGGTMAVFVFAYDNSGASGADPFTYSTANISDNAGSIWYMAADGLYDPGAASAGATIKIFYSYQERGPLLNDSTNSLHINFTGTAPTAKAGVFIQVTPSAGFFPLFVSAGVSVGSGTGTPTVTTGSITSGNIVVGGAAFEGVDTYAGDADTTNGTWSTKQSTSIGATTSAMSVLGQYKVVTGTATQTFNPTLTSADGLLGWASFTEYKISDTKPINSGSGFFGI